MGIALVGLIIYLCYAYSDKMVAKPPATLLRGSCESYRLSWSASERRSSGKGGEPDSIGELRSVSGIEEHGRESRRTSSKCAGERTAARSSQHAT